MNMLARIIKATTLASLALAGCGPTNVAAPTSQPYIVVNVQVGSATQPAVVVTVSGHVFAKEPVSQPAKGTP